MRCEAVRNNLDHLIRGQLALEARERIEAHLKHCEDCRRHLGHQQRLAVLLASLPQPPAVPEGFAERLIDAARQRQASRQPEPASRWRRRWQTLTGPAGRRVTQAAALAGGLLIGVAVGQQTWHSVHPPMSQPTVQPDPLAVYGLDYLTDAPGGSLVQSYLRLTKTPEYNGT